MWRHTILGLALSVAILLSPSRAMDGGGADADAMSSRLMAGTWEVTYAKAPDIRHLKVVGRDHFMWTTYQKSTGKPLQVCGGKWFVKGNKLTETVLFANFSQEDMDAALGQEQAMDIEFEGEDRVNVSGLNKPSGKRWSEVMTRVKDADKKPAK
jgi:hypothetical protein